MKFIIILLLIFNYCQPQFTEKPSQLGWVYFTDEEGSPFFKEPIAKFSELDKRIGNIYGAEIISTLESPKSEVFLAKVKDESGREGYTLISKDFTSEKQCKKETFLKYRTSIIAFNFINKYLYGGARRSIEKDSEIAVRFLTDNFDCELKHGYIWIQFSNMETGSEMIYFPFIRSIDDKNYLLEKGVSTTEEATSQDTEVLKSFSKTLLHGNIKMTLNLVFEKEPKSNQSIRIKILRVDGDDRIKNILEGKLFGPF